MQAFHRVSDLLVSGTDAALRSLQGYAGRAWLLAAWQDMFVDRVQGQLQHFYLSLLARAAPRDGPDTPYVEHVMYVDACKATQCASSSCCLFSGDSPKGEQRDAGAAADCVQGLRQLMCMLPIRRGRSQIPCPRAGLDQARVQSQLQCHVWHCSCMLKRSGVADPAPPGARRLPRAGGRAAGGRRSAAAAAAAARGCGGACVARRRGAGVGRRPDARLGGSGIRAGAPPAACAARREAQPRPGQAGHLRAQQTVQQCVAAGRH